MPPVFNEILDELLDETTAMFAEEHEMEQMQMRRMESTGSTSKAELEKSLGQAEAIEETKEVGTITPEVNIKKRKSLTHTKGIARFLTDAPSNSQ